MTTAVAGVSPQKAAICLHLSLSQLPDPLCFWVPSIFFYPFRGLVSGPQSLRSSSRRGYNSGDCSSKLVSEVWIAENSGLTGAQWDSQGFWSTVYVLFQPYFEELKQYFTMSQQRKQIGNATMSSLWNRIFYISRTQLSKQWHIKALESSKAGWKSWLHNHLVAGSSVSYVTSLSLFSFLVCTIGAIITMTS